MAEKIEKTTQLILGVFAILLFILYFMSTLGHSEWIKYVFVLVSFVLAAVIISEAGVFSYFKTQGYKKISFSDIIIWLSLILAGGVIINGFLMIQAIGQAAPTWLLSYAKTSGAIISGLGTLIAIVYMVTPRLKA